MDCINIRKAAVVGCGFVGAATAFALMQSGLFSELVLIDSDKEKAEGEALDISHGMPFAKPMDIYAGDYDDITDANLVIVTAGAGQKPVKLVLIWLRIMWLYSRRLFLRSPNVILEGFCSS